MTTVKRLRDLINLTIVQWKIVETKPVWDLVNSQAEIVESKPLRRSMNSLPGKADLFPLLYDPAHVAGWDVGGLICSREGVLFHGSSTPSRRTKRKTEIAASRRRRYRRRGQGMGGGYAENVAVLMRIRLGTPEALLEHLPYYTGC